jgi:hypothetical protein
MLFLVVLCAWLGYRIEPDPKAAMTSGTERRTAKVLVR